MGSFLNVVFTMEMAVANTTLSTTPIGDVPAPIALAATTVYYNPAFQVGVGATTVPIPPPAPNGTQILYVKNLDDTNYITITMTPTGQQPTDIIIPAGGAIIYFNPSVAPPGGFTSVLLTASTSTVNAEVFLGY